MKRTILICAIALLPMLLNSQTPESIQKQINDLEDTRKNLQKQIEEIDSEISVLQNEKQKLSMEANRDGIPGITRQEADLYDKISVGSRKVISTIPKDTRLIVTSYRDGSYKTMFNGIVGYLPAYQFALDDPSKRDILEEIGKQEYQDRLAENEQQKKLLLEQRIQESNVRLTEKEKHRQEYILSKYSASDAQKIIDRMIWIGMTKEMLIDSWGELPDNKINRTVGSWGVHEQWVYGDTYVYIENGKVTSWQD